ncbi:MAG: ribonuclease Z [Candidatus Omnitrophica bacterium]|nr:ribonuclease Z [Candidatus Omnitrophota bacterium]
MISAGPGRYSDMNRKYQPKKVCGKLSASGERNRKRLKMSKITLTLLGTTAGVPTKQRAHSAVHLRYSDAEEFCCLFDCGEGTQRQILFAGLNMMKLDHIFITHWHGDHCLGLPGVIDTMGFEGRQRPLTVHAPQAKKNVSKYRQLSVSMAKFRVLSQNVNPRGKKTQTIYETDRFRVVSVPVKHSIPAVAYAFIEKEKTVIDIRKAMQLGLPEEGPVYKELKEKKEVSIGGRRVLLEDVSHRQKGKKVVFSGDTELCDSLRQLVEGADLLVQDCTYFDDVGPDKPYMHASLPEVVEMVRQGGVGKTVLTHISRKYQDQQRLEKLVEKYPEMIVAEDLMEVSV